MPDYIFKWFKQRDYHTAMLGVCALVLSGCELLSGGSANVDTSSKKTSDQTATVSNAAFLPTVIAGDASGPILSTSVKKIQGNKVSSVAPTINWQFLRWDAGTSQWAPGKLLGTSPISVFGREISIQSASASTAGYVAPEDYRRFEDSFPIAGNASIAQLTVKGRLERSCNFQIIRWEATGLGFPANQPAQSIQWNTGTPSGTPSIGYNNHCYMKFDQSVTWFEAARLCQRMGGYLATLTTQKEDDFLTLNLTISGTASYWIGLNDIDKEGTFRWVTGEPAGITRGVVTDSANQIWNNFYGWDPATPSGQPDDAGGVEDCVQIRADYGKKWNDADCTSAGANITGYICERDF